MHFRLLSGLLLILVFNAACEAAEVAEGATTAVLSGGGLTVIDWIIVACYASGTIGLGWYFSRRQASTSEYFVGSGAMNPILIGVSLFATLLSTISYLSMPGESLGKGPVFMTGLVALPFVFLVVSYGLLPVYKRNRVTSAYELLEAKLGLSVRLLGATMFLFLRLFWMALMIYLTSIALANMIGVDEKWSPLIAAVTGAIAVIYTSLGGLRAVVITDLLQTLLLYGGALTVIGIITWKMGGFVWFPTEWHPQWDRQPIFPTSPSTRITAFGVVLANLVWSTCTLGGDQTSVQRFMSVKDLGAARWALAMQLTVSAIVGLTLGLVGVALLGYFTAHPELLGPDMDLKANADKMFPFFIARHLPPVVSGLVVSAMLAAAMSSIDSGVNSITAVVMTDYLDRFGRTPKSERQQVIMSRCLALGIGLFVVVASTQIGNVPGNFTAMTKKVSELLTTPIFALFVFALFIPFASSRGVWIGAVCGVTTAVLIAFSGPLFGTVLDEHGVEIDPISFQWIGPVALAVNLITGCIGSLIFPRKPTAEVAASNIA